MTSSEPLSVEQLLELPFMREVPLEVLQAVLPHVSVSRFRAGDTILTAGQYFDAAYLLVSGRVEVQLPQIGKPPKGGAARAVEGVPVNLLPGQWTSLGPGEIFGEGSALTRYPIAFDVRAASDVRCFLLKSQALRSLFDTPELSAFKDLFDSRYKERTLVAHLGNVDLFEHLDAGALRRLIERAELVTFKRGARIAVEGEPCENFYLVRGGYIQVSVKTEAKDAAVTYLRVGDWIGEASLLVDVPWPFSLSAVDTVELVKLTQQDLRAAVPWLIADPRLWETMVQRLRTRGRVASDPASSRALQLAIDSGLINGQSVLLIDLETCTRCDECVRACADTHHGVPRFVREGDRFERFSVPAACYHCADPVCMAGCPTGAITRPLGTFEVAVDESACIGCGACVQRCPWGNIMTSPVLESAGKVIDVATKCDLCIGRPAGPACVQMCPQGSAERVNFKDDARLTALLRR